MKKRPGRELHRFDWWSARSCDAALKRTKHNRRRAIIPAVVLTALAGAVISLLSGISAEWRAHAQRSGLDSSELNIAAPVGAYQGDYMPGELLIAFRPGTPRGKIDEIREASGASVIKEFREIGAQHWRLSSDANAMRLAQALSSNPNVRYAEPNYIYSADQLPSSPNDSYRSDLWGMHNLGQSGGTAGADINAPEAWSITTGSSDVVIGVIDSGVDYTHPDLQNNIWTNPGETPNNGIDDDGNGYIDDVRGWDFANNDNDPMDDNGHGTHVSGTIGAEGNNALGVVGVNWRVRLMPLKFLGANGSGDTASAVSAILYAAKFKDTHGANVVRITSNSWGGGKKSTTLQDAITNSGSLFVAAAGNGATNQLSYPAGYNNANIISVAATDHNDGLASFSNYSSNWVDLAAPGVNVASTYRGGQYAVLSGTSMATPHVSGVAGLVLAQMPSLSVAQVKARILDNVDAKPSLAGKTVTGGRLNAARALGSGTPLADGCAAASCSPADVTDLSVDSPTSTSLTLHWTATGDDGGIGSAYLEDVRYSTSQITADNFSQATVANHEPVPSPAGSPESFTVEGLKPQTTYYFAMSIADEVGNYSGIATVSGTTDVAPWSVSVLEDNANDLGFYSSLAYDGSSHPSIAYSDYTANSIKFARWTGGDWSFQTVDTTSRTGTSLAYNPAGEPSVSYGWGPLKFAQYVPSTGSWQVTTVESKNAYNDVTSLKYAPDGSPSISYRTSSNSGRGYLKFARRSSTGWTLQSVEAAGARYSSLAYDAGNPSIAYSDDVDGDGTLDTLKLARWDGSKWVIQRIETGVAGYGVMASLAYDSDHNPAIVHSVSGSVRFVKWNGSSWVPEVVASGYYPSMVYSGVDGSFYVSYVQSDNTVKIARRDSSGNWTEESIDFGNQVRWIIQLAMSGCGTPSAAYSTSPNNDVRFATKCQPGP